MTVLYSVHSAYWHMMHDLVRDKRDNLGIQIFSVKRKAKEAIDQAKQDAEEAERNAKRSKASAILPIQARSKMERERD